jgi:hypothetical protein
MCEEVADPVAPRQHGWYSPTLAVRHGYAVWTDGEKAPIKCSVITPSPSNPFPIEIVDGRYVGEVYEYLSHEFGMLPPMITVNPLTWYETFPPEYHLLRAGLIGKGERRTGHYCTKDK